eukprot:8611168-Lingulodinium_polyedra.AAC.1
MLDSATMRLHRLTEGSKEALRLASLPWDAPRSFKMFEHNINGVHVRRRQRGVRNSEEFHI